MYKNLKAFIYNLPKAELHVHIEGTMEPEQFLYFARRNNIDIPYKTVQEPQLAYRFSDFDSFINAYVHISTVLCTQEDFYELTLAYLKKVADQGVLHTEIFFDIQTYLLRDIKPAVVINGIHDALVDGGKKWGISGALILCIRRDLSQESAFEALEQSLPFKDKIVSVGLASIEKGNPLSKFDAVFAQARSYGYHCVAHAGEEGPPSYIKEAIELLKVERIDHGIRAIEDPALMKELVQRKIPLTVCPLSNYALGIVKNLKYHPLKKMIDAGVITTINSDDPAFFGGYIAENYYAAITQMGLSIDNDIECAKNSFVFSFASDDRKKECLTIVQEYVAKQLN